MSAGFQIKSRPTDGSIINSAESPNNCKIFVGGISKNTNTDSLRSYFEKYGEVRDVDIKIDMQTQASRGFGFVLFQDPSSISAMEQDTQQHYLDGKRIDPKRAEKRNAKIFVGGLKSDFDDEAIQGVFSQHGEIELYERRSDKVSGRKQAFAFITFKDDQVATRLCKQHWMEVLGKRCEIKTAVENKDKKIAAGLWGRGGGHMGGYGQGGGYGQYGGQAGGYGGYGGQAGGYGQAGGAWGAGAGPAAGGYGAGYDQNAGGYGGFAGGGDAYGQGAAAGGGAAGAYSGYGSGAYGGGAGGGAYGGGAAAGGGGYGGGAAGGYGQNGGAASFGGRGGARGGGRGGGPMRGGGRGGRPAPY